MTAKLGPCRNHILPSLKCNGAETVLPFQFQMLGNMHRKCGDVANYPVTIKQIFPNVQPTLFSKRVFIATSHSPSLISYLDQEMADLWISLGQLAHSYLGIKQ